MNLVNIQGIQVHELQVRVAAKGDQELNINTLVDCYSSRAHGDEGSRYYVWRDAIPAVLLR